MIIKAIREKVGDFFGANRELPKLTEHSTLHEISSQCPHVYEFVERKYGIKVEAEDRSSSLKHFVEKFGLPPAQILFMEVQMAVRTQHVNSLLPLDAKNCFQNHPDAKFLDVREEWEQKICRLEGSVPLTPEKLDEILNLIPKETPLVLYCHFGVRSLDAATFLADRGFTKVFTLSGGIDRWSAEVDPSVPRYSGGYC